MKSWVTRFPRTPTGWFWGCLFLMLLGPVGCGRPATTPPGPNASAPPASQLIPLTNMVLIKAGSFQRGKQLITLTSDYWLSKYETDQGEYAALMGKNPSKFVGDLHRPVEKVSHLDAQAYCAEVSRRERSAGHLPANYAYRLPTEAEWEYACRAGSTNRFSFGEETGEADKYAWTDENSEATSHPVGQKLPNAWGLYDMHGNVWEWVQDWFAQYPVESQTNPVGPSTSKFKVFRGGGWNNEIQFARSGNRFMMGVSNGIHFVGFRMALGRVQDP